MNNNLCNECGTLNEPEFAYCKNCGAPIAKPEEPVAKTQANSQQAYAANNYATNAYTNTNYTNPNGYVVESFEGVSKEEMAIFVGKKANTILPKFTKMEITAGKISWNWPLAILGYLFGPFGASLWFFYRKMYKHALSLAGIGALIHILSSVMLLGVDENAIMNLFDELLKGDPTVFLNSYSQLGTFNMLMIMLSGSLKNIANLASSIILGLFGFHFYKNHCTNKIMYYRSVQADQRYYQLGLASIGGVSGGMLALGIIIWYGVTFATEFVLSIVKLFI